MTSELLTAYDGLLVRAGLYLVVFWPTVGYYVYDDSKKRGLRNPSLRGVFYGFFGLLGLVVYMVRKGRAGD
ncbi:MAG: hypothetical protein U5J64_00525 [Halobacteriales archaeon]|nr:hypothetical protein [Halobacteriales archaeon]